MSEKVRKVTLTAPVNQQLKKHHPISSTMDEEVREDVLENGRIVSRLVIKSVNMADRMKGLKDSDFSLESQIYAGSLPDSPSHYTSTGGLDSTCAALNAAADALEHAAVGSSSSQSDK